MELINTSHADFEKSRNWGNMFLSIGTEYRVYISARLAVELGLTKTKVKHYMHFITEVDRLYILINTDKDGAPILPGKNRNTTTYIANRVRLIRLVLEKCKALKKSHPYPVRKSNNEFKGCQLWEVMLHNKVITKTK